MKKIFLLLAIGTLALMSSCKNTQVKSAPAEQAALESSPAVDTELESATDEASANQFLELMAWHDRFQFYLQFMGRLTSPNDCWFAYREHGYGKLESPPENVSIEFKIDDFKYEDVREARQHSLGEDYAEFENYIDALIAAMDAFKPALEALDRYVKSREYLVDHGAFLKAQDEKFDALALTYVKKYTTTRNYINSKVWFQHHRDLISKLKSAGQPRLAAVYGINLAFAEFYWLSYWNDPAEEDEEDSAEYRAALAESEQEIKQKAEDIKKAVDELHLANTKKQDDYTEAYSAVEDAALQLVGACRQYGVKFNTADFDDVMRININLLQPRIKTLFDELGIEKSYKGIVMDKSLFDTKMGSPFF